MPRPCPTCSSCSTSELSQRTVLGYRRFRCRDCGRRFNERSGTPFNFLEVPTDIMLLVVRWRLRYTLSLRDLAEMFLDVIGFQGVHWGRATRSEGASAAGEEAVLPTWLTLQQGCELARCYHVHPSV